MSESSQASYRISKGDTVAVSKNCDLPVRHIVGQQYIIESVNEDGTYQLLDSGYDSWRGDEITLTKRGDEYMGSEIAKLSDVAQTLAYKLRLVKLDKTKRTLRKHNIENGDGFLTMEGAQIFLDALWQRSAGNDDKFPNIQKEIADSLIKMQKEDRRKKKDDDDEN